MVIHQLISRCFFMRYILRLLNLNRSPAAVFFPHPRAVGDSPFFIFTLIDCSQYKRMHEYLAGPFIVLFLKYIFPWFLYGQYPFYISILMKQRPASCEMMFMMASYKTRKHFTIAASVIFTSNVLF